MDHWANISHEQREKRESRFLADKEKPNVNVVISTDGLRSVSRIASAVIKTKPKET